jgi:hypothetical protein
MSKLSRIGKTIIHKCEIVIDALYIWNRRCWWRNVAKKYMCGGKSLTV